MARPEVTAALRLLAGTDLHRAAGLREAILDPERQDRRLNRPVLIIGNITEKKKKQE